METVLEPPTFEMDTPRPVLAGAAKWVVFSLDGDRYALPLEAVQRIVRAARVTPLPSAPSIVLGALDVEGDVLPVFNIRRRLGLPERDIDPANQFVIARSAHRTVVLVIDAAHGVLECDPTDTISAQDIVTGLEHIHGVIRLADGLALIHDLERFLSIEESRTLDEALTAGIAHVG